MNRVLVVDDEAGMRAALEAHFVRRDWLVDTASNAGEAMEKFRRGLHPLVVTDIRMPGPRGSSAEDGFSVMRQAQAMAPHTAVILLTAFASVPDAVHAMKGGACDYVPKQLSSSSLNILHIREDLIRKIKAAAGSRHSLRCLDLPRKAPRAVELTPRQGSHPPPEIVAIGISTGGPKALQEVLPALPGDLPIPIVVVQHMPPGFTEPFARRMNTLCPATVREAAHGENAKPGVIYIAPAGWHTTIERPTGSRITICLSERPRNQLHVPSADVMMQSVASAFGSLAMGIIMTGMGSDGAQGMSAIHREGGLTVGQDELTCAVYGMPRVCAEMGILDRVVPLAQIPYEIMQATQYRKASVG
jgi:two-component system chemotaxis response regulator CheB